MKESGLAQAFRLIMQEIVIKKIVPDQVFAFAASRLRQLERGPAAKSTPSPRSKSKPTVLSCTQLIWG